MSNKMTFEKINPGDTIWYQNHRQYDDLRTAKVISIDRCRKRSCIIKFYHETLNEEFKICCLNSSEADNYVGTSKEALKAYIIRRLKEEDEKTSERIEAEIQNLRHHRECIRNSIDRIEKI